MTRGYRFYQWQLRQTMRSLFRGQNQPRFRHPRQVLFMRRIIAEIAQKKHPTNTLEWSEPRELKRIPKACKTPRRKKRILRAEGFLSNQ